MSEGNGITMTIVVNGVRFASTAEMNLAEARALWQKAFGKDLPDTVIDLIQSSKEGVQMDLPVNAQAPEVFE